MLLKFKVCSWTSLVEDYSRLWCGGSALRPFSNRWNPILNPSELVMCFGWCFGWCFDILNQKGWIQLQMTFPSPRKRVSIVSCSEHLRSAAVSAATVAPYDAIAHRQGMELVAQPLLLFADEPTSGLDSTTSHEADKWSPICGLRKR